MFKLAIINTILIGILFLVIIHYSSLLFEMLNKIYKHIILKDKNFIKENNKNCKSLEKEYK